MAENPDYLVHEVQLFVNEMCVLDPRSEVDMVSVYDAFRCWCERTGRPEWSATFLGRGLRGLGYVKRKSSGRILRRGIRLRTDAPRAGTVPLNCPQPSPALHGHGG